MEWNFFAIVFDIPWIEKRVGAGEDPRSFVTPDGQARATTVGPVDGYGSKQGLDAGPFVVAGFKSEKRDGYIVVIYQSRTIVAAGFYETIRRIRDGALYQTPGFAAFAGAVV